MDTKLKCLQKEQFFSFYKNMQGAHLWGITCSLNQIREDFKQAYFIWNKKISWDSFCKKLNSDYLGVFDQNMGWLLKMF